MIVRKINKNDIESVSKLHVTVFDKSYFSVYYSIPDLNEYFSKLIDLNKYSYVAEVDNKITGYLIGGFKTQEAVDIFLRVKRKKILFYVLTNPKFIKVGIIKVLKKLFSKKNKSNENLRLFLIGVDPKKKNMGVGARLIKKFEEDIDCDGHTSYGLYVRTNNLNAIDFYLNRGFTKEFKKFDLYSFTKKLS
jgi:ribosomal protein S18 acetylase RimI-like enzyme